MQDFLWSAYCRKLVQWMEQSLEMCDLYSAAPNAFVLLRSCISFASLSLSFFFLLPSDALSLPAATHLVHLDLSQPTTFSAALPVSLFLLAFFPAPSFLSIISFPISLSCLFCMCRCDTGALLQSNCNKAILQCVNKTTSPRILLFSEKVVMELGNTV